MCFPLDLAYQFDASHQFINLTSPFFNTTSKEGCFVFSYYFMSRSQQFSLHLIANDDDVHGKMVWAAGTPNEDLWHTVAVRIEYVGTFKLNFEAQSREGFVAVAPIAYTLRCEVDVCSFEANNCGWVNSATKPGSPGWKNIQARDMLVAHNFDHTTRSPFGHVLYGFGGDELQISSPAYTPNHDTQCFSFWYMQIGGGVDLRLKAAGKEDHLLHEIWSNKDYVDTKGEWMSARLSINFKQYSTLTFDAKLKGNPVPRSPTLRSIFIQQHFSNTLDPQSAIALDDFGFKAFECSERMRCTFDSSFCWWSPDLIESDYTFSLGVGRVRNAQRLNRNLSAETPGGRKFAYTDFTELPAGKTGQMQLVSEYVVPPTSHKGCFQLSTKVHSFGRGDSFTVLAADTAHNSAKRTLWTYDNKATGTDRLSNYYIAMPQQSTPYRVIISVRAANPSTFIILDFTDYVPSVGKCNAADFQTTVPPTVPEPTVPASKSLDCNFDQSNFCHWNAYGAFKFGSTSLVRKLPEADRMFLPAGNGDAQNVYIYLLGSPEGRANIWAENNYAGRTVCISFWYYFYAEGESTFDLYTLNASSTPEAIWTAYGADKDKWLQASVTVPQQQNSIKRYSFQANVRKGGVALDNIKFTIGACKASRDPEVCNFELRRNTNCHIEPVVQSWTKLSWNVWRGLDFGGTFRDHTKHSSLGHVFGLRFDGSKIQKNPSSMFIDYIAVLRPSLPQVACMRFFYYLNGANLTLSYSIVKGNDAWRRKQWQTRESTDGLWFVHQQTFQPPLASNQKITFQVNVPMGEDHPKGAVVIDDIALYQYQCENQDLNCNFDSGDYCQMEPVLNYQRPAEGVMHELTKLPPGSQVTTEYLTGFVTNRWLVFTPLKSQRFLPFDGTSDNGHYLLMPGGAANERAIMITQQIRMAKASDGVCLSFLYALDSDSRIEIYQAEEGRHNKAVKLWTLNMPANWMDVALSSVPTNRAQRDVYFFLVATTFDVYGYLAIDNLRITRTPCAHADNQNHNHVISTPPTSATTNATTGPPPNSFKCDDGRYISQDKVCDYINDCAHKEDEKYCGSCDFAHHDWCRFRVTHKKFTSVIWNFVDSFPGFKLDPSSAEYSDVFMMAYGAEGTTDLESEIIHKTYLNCEFSFEYVFDLEDNVVAHHKPKLNSTDTKVVGALDVHIESVETLGRVHVWQSSAQPFQAGKWIEQRIYLRSIGYPFRIVFSAVKHSNFDPWHIYSHGVRLLHMRNCGPPTPSRDSQCDPNYFRCNNRVCLDKALVCDFRDDCGDGSDEHNCDPSRMTDFENIQPEANANNYNGLRVSGDHKIIDYKSNQNDFRSAPPFDHTKGTISGRFLLFTNGKGKNLVEIATPPIQGGPCRLDFFHMFQSVQRWKIQVFIRHLPEGKEDYKTFFQTNTYSWERVHYRTEESRTMFRLVFKVELAPLNETGGMSQWVAFDDFSFGLECKLLKESDVPTVAPKVSTVPPDNGCPTMWCLGLASNLKCLKQSQICDFHRDCLDGRDERNCGNCTFDDGTSCGWKVGTFDQLGLMVIKPANTAPSGGSLPTVDGRGHATGGYLTLHNDGFIKGQRIISPIINAAVGEDCTFQLSYFAPKTSYLAVRLRFADTNTLRRLATLTDKYTNWKDLQFRVGKQTRPFSVELLYSFMVKPPATSKTVNMAMDNFQLTYCTRNGKPNKTSSFKDLSCNFDTNLCGWMTFSPSPFFIGSWSRVSDRQIPPGHDHTHSDQFSSSRVQGFWLACERTISSNFKTDYLINELPLAATTTTTCFTFWYVFYGDKANNFSVSVLTDPKKLDELVLWERHIPQSRDWVQATIEIPRQSKPFYIMFYGLVYPSQTLGIDDVMVKVGQCPKSNDVTVCDFELRTCNWKAAGWSRKAANGTMPDHTTGAAGGHYMADARIDQTVTLSTNLGAKWPYLSDRNPNLPLYKTICFQLWYYLAVPKAPSKSTSQSQLTINIRSTNIPVGKLSLNLTDVLAYNQTNQWNMFAGTTRALAGATIEIVGLLREQGWQLMIDDISLLPRACQDDGNCDFENDMCGWRNAHRILTNEKTVLWMRYRPTQDAGAYRMSTDNTTGTSKGNYLLLDISADRFRQAVLASPIIKRRSSKICFRMSYFGKSSYSVPLLSLAFVNLTETRSDSIELLTEIPVRHQMQWFQFQQEFVDLPSAYAFKIYVHYSGTPSSDLGIDDIRIVQGGCPGMPDVSTTTPTPPVDVTTMDCNFDSAKCGWSWDSRWKQTNYKAVSTNTPYAPAKDHTFGLSTNNYLLYVGGDDKPAKVTSKVYVPHDTKYCFSFWYYEDGGFPFNVYVNQAVHYLKTLHNLTRSRVTNTIEGGHWKMTWVEFNSYSLFLSSKLALESFPNIMVIIVDLDFSLSITFQGGASSSSLKIFALDDLKLEAGPCQGQKQYDYVYTFTDGIGDLRRFAVTPTISEMGEVQNGSKVAAPFLPSYDHTTYTSAGDYFLFYSDNHAATWTLYRTALSMKNLKATSRSKCLRFAYQLLGNASLAIYARMESSFSNDPKDMTLLFARSNYDIAWWTIVELATDIKYDHQLVFMMEKHQNAGTSFIALDDIGLVQTCYPAINCDFEGYRTCSYTPYVGQTSTKPRYDWGVHESMDQIKNWPGPRYDHTTNNFGGGYLFLTAYRSTFSKIVSSMASGLRRVQPQSYCLSLWTQLTANDVGLRIYIQVFGSTGGSNVLTKVYEAVDQAPTTKWTQVLVSLGQDKLKGATDLQVIFEGQLSANSKGVVALDDILLSPGQCKASGMLCEDGTQLKASQMCNFVKDCPSGLDEANCGTCNFEQGSDCGWHNVAGFGKFAITSGSTAKNLPVRAPIFDADGFSDGHYYMVYTDKNPTNNVVGMIGINYENPSMFLKNAYTTCSMQFDYNIVLAQAEQRFSILVSIADSSTSSTSSVVYHVLPELGYTSGWRRAVVSIGERYNSFYVRITVGFDAAHSLMALDNIQFNNCSMPKPVSSVAQCPTRTADVYRLRPVLCATSHYCIGDDQMCDWKNDCNDGYDEAAANCPSWSRSCDFEGSLLACGITTKKNEVGDSYRSNFHWRLGLAADATPRTDFFPPIDSTL